MLRIVADCTNTVADQGTALEIRRTIVAGTRSRGGILPALAVPAHLLVPDVGCMFAALDIATLRIVPDYFRSGSAGRMGYSDHSSLAAATVDTARLDSLTYCRPSEHSDLPTARLRSRRCYGCSHQERGTVLPAGWGRWRRAIRMRPRGGIVLRNQASRLPKCSAYGISFSSPKLIEDLEQRECAAFHSREVWMLGE